ncbi:NUDE protein [Geopyxis carbonaria]|nr:NUDE protein [Geopyxis carbonaria]
MPSLDMPAPDSSDDIVEFYKSQVRELEAELSDFQASSKELEAELEKELEASETQHRDLRLKVEALEHDVNEWKGKYKQSKAEANSAQNALQKEITSLRDANRTLQLKLRDIEVSNDDFERQERIQQSSLEDLESKYNQSIERGVMQDEEIKCGELEREQLRIDAQRLKDELSDLKVEQEITLEKLNSAMAMAARNGSLHHVPPPSTFTSPLSETSSVITDSPITSITTPSGVSSSTAQSEHSSPPSPPMSEVSTTPSQSSRITRPLDDPATTPRPRHFQKPRKHSRGPSLGGGSALPMPSSKSLHQIRGLIGQMQRLEQRVQSARSKLPGPVNTPPRASPRDVRMGTNIPSSITMRSQRKSRPGSTTSSVTSGGDRDMHGFHPISRPSFGTMDRPASRAERPERPESRMSRPGSRASGTTSRSSIGYGGSGIPQRPQSRASVSGRITPAFGEYDTTPTVSRGRRSLGGDDGAGLSRRNTLSNSAIPLPSSGLPRRSIGGRRSGVVDDGFLGGHGSRRTLKKQLSGVGEK